MEIVNALWITLIGMGLVFIAILLLWGLMALLVRVTAEKEGRKEEPMEAAPQSMVSDAIPDDALLYDRKRRAAAAAVAVAAAAAAGQKRLLPTPVERPAGAISSWQAVNRASQMSQRINASRKKVSR